MSRAFINPSRASRVPKPSSLLQELIELGMKLARAAAQKALQALEAPAPAPEDKPQEKTPDHGQFFLRLWASVTKTIALQSRVTAAPKTQPRAPAPQPPSTQAAPAPDPTARLQARLVELKREFENSRK